MFRRCQLAEKIEEVRCPKHRRHPLVSVSVSLTLAGTWENYNKRHMHSDTLKILREKAPSLSSSHTTETSNAPVMSHRSPRRAGIISRGPPPRRDRAGERPLRSPTIISGRRVNHPPNNTVPLCTNKRRAGRCRRSVSWAARRAGDSWTINRAVMPADRAIIGCTTARCAGIQSVTSADPVTG